MSRPTGTSSSPIVGFQVKDRLGQVLFADNTYLTTMEQPVAVSAGQRFQAEFCFQMPLLPVGDYVIRVAVAMGSRGGPCDASLHRQCARLPFDTSGARHGLVGVPMQHVRLRTVRVNAVAEASLARGQPIARRSGGLTGRGFRATTRSSSRPTTAR